MGKRCEFCEALRMKYVLGVNATAGTGLHAEYGVKLSSVMYNEAHRGAAWETGKEFYRLNRCPVCGADIKKRLRTWKDEVE